jgi:hypothetical protein
LQAIAATLRDDSRPVDPRQVASVEAFLLAFDSPFRGFDASAACRAAAILEDEIVGGHVVPRHVTVIAA